jgi:tRNA G26 N,N-dimethylase Trm1
MVNNFDQIRNILEFDNDDIFYHLQILKRRKENPEMDKGTVVIKTYYISSKEYFDSKIEDIINYCNKHNARAYINLNKKSYEVVAFQMLKETADFIQRKKYHSVKNLYDKVCGAYGGVGDKVWILDIDDVEQVDKSILDFINNECEPDGDKIIDIVKTKNGFHVLTKRFNIKKFKEKYKDIEIHKNNPTVIYQP